MGAQLSLKAAMPLAEILATCRKNVSNTGPWTSMNKSHSGGFTTLFIIFPPDCQQTFSTDLLTIWFQEFVSSAYSDCEVGKCHIDKMVDILYATFQRPFWKQNYCTVVQLSLQFVTIQPGLGSIHFFQFNSIPIQVGFRIFQFNSIPIQIRFRIFQFNSNSIHFLSIPIQFNSNFMHRDKQMNKITGWNKFYWIVP